MEQPKQVNAMADQHDNRETTGHVNSASMMVESNTESSAAPTVNSSSQNLIGIESAPNLDRNGPTGPSTNPENAMTVGGAPGNHTTQHQPEQNEVATSSQETDKHSVIRTGAEGASTTERDPSEVLHHLAKEDILNSLTPNPQIPPEPNVKPSISMGDPEPKVDAHSLNDTSHTSELRSIAQSPLGEALRSGKGSDTREPKVATSPVTANLAENVNVHHHASPTSQEPMTPAAEPEPLAESTETETRVPVVENTQQPNDPASISHEPPGVSHEPSEISHEPSGAPIHAETFMQESEPVREALPKSEESVAADPAAAIIPINVAATEIDQIMEHHHLNSNFEVEHSPDKTGLESVTHAEPRPEMGSRGTAQQNNMPVLGSASDTFFASHPVPTIQENPAPQTGLDAHQSVENETSRINSSLDHQRFDMHDPTEDQVPHGTHRPLGVHEPMENQAQQATDPPSNVHEPTASQVGAATSTVQGPSAIPVNVPETIAAYTEEIPADSVPADAEMDDGSSVSTIHAYLGAHAPSLGTGSVNGDFDDTHMDDGDSALGDDVESITESLSASMLEYRYENGRRYHAFEDGKYHLPNDEKEADRLGEVSDFQHHIWLLTLNGELHRAPIPSTIQSALDVGTGTGIWAIEFANAFPNARVIGTDLSPIQPSWVPPNLSFMVDDAEASQDWEFPQKFDYIHSRLVALSMRDWPRYTKRCYNNLKPGGWLELQEVQFPFQYDEGFPANDSPLLKWSTYVLEATARVGIDTQAADKFVDMLRDEGFVNITREKMRWPIGTWPKDPKEKEIGKWMVYNALEGVESAGMALFSRVFGWSKEEIEAFVESVRKDIRSKQTRYYCPITVAFAQKPQEPDEDE